MKIHDVPIAEADYAALSAELNDLLWHPFEIPEMLRQFGPAQAKELMRPMTAKQAAKRYLEVHERFLLSI